MFKKFKKNDKYFNIAVYVVITVSILIALVFLLINLGKIGGFIGGIISAMSAFVYGFVIAYICNSIYKKMHRYVFKFVERKKSHPKLRSVLSYFATYFIFIGVIALFAVLVIPSIGKNIELLFTNIGSYWGNFKDFGYNLLDKISSAFPSINQDDIIASFSSMFSLDGDFFKTAFSFIGNNIFRIGQATIGTLFSIIVGFILSVYFLIYKHSIIARLKRVLCAIFKRNTYEGIIDFARYTDRTFGRYIMGAIFDSTLVGLVVFIILQIIGIKFAALIGVVVGITNVIPFFGPFLGAIPSALIILVTEPERPYMVFIFVLIILIVQQIDGNLIAPHILGASTGLTPIGVIAAVTLCSHLFGFVGMVIGVPLCAVVTYYIGRFVDKKLKKKSLPSDIKYYESANVFENEEFIQASSEAEAQKRIERIVEIEKRKDEELAKENAVMEAEEKILSEINANEGSEIQISFDDTVVIEALSELSNNEPKNPEAKQ